jgi:hypothetical protein
MSESPIAEALRVLREKGVIDRSAEANIVESHAWLVSVGDLPELVRGKLHAKLVAAPDTTGSNVAGISARQTPEFVIPGTMSGTLTVDRDETHTITDEDLAALDDEPTTVGTRKGRKKH